MTFRNGMMTWTGGGGGGSSWGSITGTLSSQTDLNTALGGKQPLATVLTNTTAAFTTAQETKLSGIATAATANASDAALRDRSTHTGTQLPATISGLSTVATSGAYSDLTGRPSLATVATSGSAADLTGDLPVARLNGGASAGPSTFWRGDGTWSSVPVTGTVWGAITGTLSSQTDLQTALDAKAGLWDFIQLTADYTLTSTVAAQKLFNTTTNGAYTAATGLFEFQCLIILTTMSATSGNALFNLLGAGTATLDRQWFDVVGFDGATATNAGATSGSGALGTSSTPASMVTAGTGAQLRARIGGTFRVSSGGTIIPSVALVTAAAAVVKAGSVFMVRRIADTSTTSRGAWS